MQYNSLPLNRSYPVIADKSHDAPRNYALALCIIFVFIGMRFITAPPPPTFMEGIDGMPGGGTLVLQTHPGMAPVGLILLAALLLFNRPLGFAFIICDMLGFGYFSLDQWGLYGLFKFRDLEFLLLFLLAATMAMRSPEPPGPSEVFRKFIKRLALSIAVVIFLYTIATIYVQPFLKTLQFSRQFYVWLLVIVVPYFIRNERDLSLVIKIFFLSAIISSILYIAQTILPPQTVLPYAQQAIKGEQTRIWNAALSGLCLTGFLLFGVLLVNRRIYLGLWAVWGLVTIAIFSFQGRALALYYCLSILVIVVYNAWRRKNLLMVIRTLVPILAILALAYGALEVSGRWEPLQASWEARYQELTPDLESGQGSWTSRWGAFSYLPSLIQRQGGGDVSYLVGVGLVAINAAELWPMTIIGTVTPPIWADNAICGLVLSMGLLGLTLFLIWIVLLVRMLLHQAKQPHGPLAQGLLMGAIPYFLLAPPYMFAFAHFLGNWDEALVATVALGLIERAINFERLAQPRVAR